MESNPTNISHVTLRWAEAVVSNQAVQLWCEATGRPSDPTVLLISGAGAHAHFWTDAFCNSISKKGYRVIRFDHRDTGFSSAVDFERNPYSVKDLVGDVLAILDAFQVRRAHVVGHSMGGTIAQLMAIYHPDRLLTFTSMSVGAVGEAAAPSQEVMNALLENKPTKNFEESLPGFMRSWKLLNGTLPFDEEMAKKYTEEFYTRSLHRVGVAWNHIRCQEGMPDLPPNLKEVTVSGLFLHGEKDVLMPVSAGSSAAKICPSASLTIIPGMGHMIFNKDVQKQIATILLQHFAIRH